MFSLIFVTVYSLRAPCVVCAPWPLCGSDSLVEVTAPSSAGVCSSLCCRLDAQRVRAAHMAQVTDFIVAVSLGSTYEMMLAPTSSL